MISGKDRKNFVNSFFKFVLENMFTGFTVGENINLE